MSNFKNTKVVHGLKYLFFKLQLAIPIEQILNKKKSKLL